MIEKINVLNGKEKEIINKKVNEHKRKNEILNAKFLMKFLQRSISKNMEK